MSSSTSRRAILAGAAMLPAASLPALASSGPAQAATTPPPDLIERFVRVRAWYLDNNKREKLSSDEVDRRFYAATGLTGDQWRDIDYNDPRRRELVSVRSKIYRQVESSDDEAESEQLCDERWSVAEAMFAHEPQNVVDLAWQAEAYLLADLELYQPPEATADRLIRTIFQHIRTLAALPQPDDPLGALSINIAQEEVQS